MTQRIFSWVWSKFESHCTRTQLICLNISKTSVYRHASFYCASQVFHFLQIEGKTLHQQKEYDLFYFDARFIVVNVEPNPWYL